jgi:hypothetical protein
MVWRPVGAWSRHVALCHDFAEAQAAANKAAVEAVYPADEIVEVHAIAPGWGFPECCLYRTNKQLQQSQ